MFGVRFALKLMNLKSGLRLIWFWGNFFHCKTFHWKYYDYDFQLGMCPGISRKVGDGGGSGLVVIWEFSVLLWSKPLSSSLSFGFGPSLTKCGAKWRFKRAQTLERGPPSAQMEIFH